MRIRPGVLIAIAAVFAVLIGGRFLGLFGGKPAEVAVTQPTEETPGDTQTSASRPSTAIPIVDSGTGARPAPVTTPPVVTPPPTTPAPAAGLIADWEQKIDDVLTSQEDEAQKARRLLAIFPNLPEDGQVEAAQHLSNLLADEDYKSLSQTLTNAAMPEAVLDVLMTDVLNRPNQIKLETLYDVARLPNHPKAEEARDVLGVFLDKDDADWAAILSSGNWETIKADIAKFLKENPDE